ncbi:hypothetical protein FGB62_131g022 [Gracilaria domingensis]|nr:hypothetical protein FGB62_131g022 [Gracilaria domingensis]
MSAFVSSFVLPFNSRSSNSRLSTSRVSSLHATVWNARANVTVASASDDDGWGMDDFDRDYYDELKEEYKDNDRVHIFAKEDYELHDIDSPYLFDNRARDLEQIRKEMATRPKAHLDEHTTVDKAMLLSDMHDQTELESFKETLLTHDAINGKGWQDPMPPSDLDGDPEYIHFRKSPKPEKDPRDEDILALLGETNLLPRKLYPSEQDEIDALSSSYDMMQTEFWDEPAEPFSMGGNVDVPDPEEFAHWQAEAKARGGTAVKGDSYFLPPYKDPRDRIKRPDPPGGHTAPHQQESFIKANLGVWQGSVRVFSLHSEHKFAPQLTASFSLHSSVEKGANGAVEWGSTATAESIEHVSDVWVPSPKHGEALVPGRAVSAEGCYVVCRKNGITRQDTEFFTMSRACLESMTRNKSCRPELEIGIRSECGGLSARHRIFLCTADGKGELKDNGRRKPVKFSHVIVFKEFLTTSVPSELSTEYNVDTCTSPQEFGLEVASAAKLLGLWRGHGVVLLPEYPPMSCDHVSTRYDTSEEDSITENDVTWVENTVPDNPNQTSRRRERTVKKRKTSRRVREARMHDRRRLSECQLLIREESGQAVEEQKFAWKAMPSVDAFSSMYSPRVGHFVGDYAALLVSQHVLLMFPVSDAFPEIWNTVSAIELSRPSRLRIEAGRNDQGTLVGALFVNETVEDGAESDSVADYV